MKRFIGILTSVLFFCQPAFAGQAPDTLAKIKASQQITIAYSKDAMPFSFEEDGKPAGYSVALCQEIVAGLKKQPGMADIKVKWLAGNTPERLRMVEKGEADMECGNTSITLARQEKVDFSSETFVESGGVLVLAESGMKGLVSLADKKVAVIPGTTTEQRLLKALEGKHVSVKTVTVESAREGMKVLDAGKVDAYAGDRIVLIGQVGGMKDPSRYALLSDLFSIDPFGFALPRGDADFRLAVNRALAETYRGVALEQIFVRWFGLELEPTDILRATYLINAYQD